MDAGREHESGGIGGAAPHEERAQQLLAAAASGDLSAAERDELDALVARDPALAEDAAAFDHVVASLRSLGAGGWDDAAPPAQLRARVLAATSGSLPAPRRAARGAFALAAAGLLAVGGLGGWLVRAATGPLGAASGPVSSTTPTASATTPAPGAPTSSPAPVGPPGTLGAREPVAVSGPAGVSVQAAVVAHTWGTETDLQVSGLPAGRTYSVVLVDETGHAVTAGGFVSAVKPVDCRLNAALLRQDVTRLEVLDSGGAPVLSSALPPVGA